MPTLTYSHRNHPLCLCSDCYAKNEALFAKEPNSKYPDCDDCYMQYCPLKAQLFGKYDAYLDHFCGKHRPDPPSPKAPGKREKDDGVASRWYFITYTEHESVKDPTRVLKSALRCIKSKAVGATQWAYCLELTQTGTPHVHIRLNTEKYPDYKKCIGAFNDGFRYDVQMDKGGTAAYVVKKETKPSPAWLASKGLDNWFFSSSNYSGPRPDEMDMTVSPPLVPSDDATRRGGEHEGGGGQGRSPSGQPDLISHA